jgi:hypothetical protein
MRLTGRLPTRLGEWLVAIGALIVVVEPASGGWPVLGSGMGDVGGPENGRLEGQAPGTGAQVSAIRPESPR